MINPLIFRKYDIRGDSFQDVTPEIAFKIGYCFAKICFEENLASVNLVNKNLVRIKNIFSSPLNLQLSSPSICVVRDGRLSSEKLYQALCNGIIAAGVQVISLGIGPSPLLYFADYIIRPCGSIMITASHNPKNDNGFKMILGNKSFYGDNLQELYHQVKDINITENKFTAEILELDLIENYLTTINNNLNISPELKVMWDPGHGATCEIIKKLFHILPNHNAIINGDMDGNFPNRSPDPSNPQTLIRAVQENNYDLGIALDGDGDRLIGVSAKGEIIAGEKLLYLFAQDILTNHPNSKIIGDVKINQSIFNQINIWGGKAIMCKTGHPFIKEKLFLEQAILAGEASGHLFFNDRYFGFDDGVYAALRLIELISKTNIFLPKLYSKEIKITISDSKKFTIIEQLKQYLIDTGTVFNDIDGIRVVSNNEWWLIRASNTENLILVRYGSQTSEELDVLTIKLKNLLNIFING